MPTGKLKIEISDVRGRPIGEEITVKLEKLEAGGQSTSATLDGTAATSFTIGKIEAPDGPTTRYKVSIETDRYFFYAFFQSMTANKTNSASDRVRLMVQPKKVKDIAAPAFSGLPKAGRDMLSNASMLVIEEGDGDLVGLSGSNLYDALGPLRKAAFLNILKKAAHRATSDNCLRFVRGLHVVRQDRLFAEVDPKILDLMQKSEAYKSAPNTLHAPLAGFEVADSFKTRDAHANLQVTLMRKARTGDIAAADIDIDEATGFAHGIEVIRNSLFKQRTRPYLIRELLILADTEELTLDPGYDFVF